MKKSFSIEQSVEVKLFKPRQFVVGKGASAARPR